VIAYSNNDMKNTTEPSPSSPKTKAKEETFLESFESLVANNVDESKLRIIPAEIQCKYYVEYVANDANWGTGILVVDEPDERHVTVASGWRFSIPVKSRNAIGELTNRINTVKESDSAYLYLDMEEGTLALVCSINLRDGALTWAMLSQMLENNLSIMKMFTKPIMEVLNSGATAKEAMKYYQEKRAVSEILH
jgi:hypothetical protein